MREPTEKLTEKQQELVFDFRNRLFDQVEWGYINTTKELEAYTDGFIEALRLTNQINSVYTQLEWSIREHSYDVNNYWQLPYGEGDEEDE